MISRCFRIEIDVKNTQKVSKHRYFDIESPWKHFEKIEKKNPQNRDFSGSRGGDPALRAGPSGQGTPCRSLAGKAIGYKIMHSETTKGRTAILRPDSESSDLPLFE